MHELFKNNKTGKLYFVFGKATNTTNELDGQEMITYTAVGKMIVFVRERDEFFKKFTKVDFDERK